jgi:hypothetical protein
LAFLIFQIPPEKVGATPVITALGVSGTGNLYIIKPGKIDGSKTGRLFGAASEKENPLFYNSISSYNGRNGRRMAI